MTPEEIKVLGQRTKAQNKRDSIRNYTIGVMFTALLVLSYKFAKGDFKFLLRETALTTAIVTKTNMYPYGKGYYKQTVWYTYKHEGKTYEGNFEAGKRAGIHQVGWPISIRYAIDAPEIHEVE